MPDCAVWYRRIDDQLEQITLVLLNTTMFQTGNLRCLIHHVVYVGLPYKQEYTLIFHKTLFVVGVSQAFGGSFRAGALIFQSVHY